jgi:hypothetical protein
MAWFNLEAQTVLNVVVIGNDCSGSGLIQHAISRHPKAICHSNLFHKSKAVRQEHHERYFGKPDSENVVDWYEPATISVEHYLNNKIFDNALCGEAVVGARVPYETMLVNELDDYFKQRCDAKKLCMIHVYRNPIACFIAKEQKRLKTEHSVYISPQEITDYVRKHDVAAIRLREIFSDYLEFNFHEILLDYTQAVKHVCQFLELAFSPGLVNRELMAYHRSNRYSIINWKELASSCNAEVRAHLENPDFF